MNDAVVVGGEPLLADGREGRKKWAGMRTVGFRPVTENMICSVIIATCDRTALLEKALHAVGEAVRASGEPHEIVVVDNGLREKADEVAARFARESGCAVKCLTSEPGSKSAALNAGIAAAGAEWLAFTDDDCLPAPGWLAEASKFRDETGLDAFGGRVVADSAGVKLPRWLVAGRSGRVPRGPAIVDYEPMAGSGIPDDRAQVPLGSNFFARKRLFEKHGGYDEALWKRCGAAALGCEDAEFSMRIRSRGERNGYCAESVVTHPVYPDRMTLRHHLRWAFRMGVRETVLFGSHRCSRGYLLRQFVKRAGSCLLAMCAADPAAAVCEAMLCAEHIGQMASAREESLTPLRPTGSGERKPANERRTKDSE